jgi:hypothetical protein
VQQQSQSIDWGFEAQGLSRALIEPQGARERRLPAAQEIRGDGDNDVAFEMAVLALEAIQSAIDAHWFSP